MSHRTVNVVYSKKGKRLIYKDIIVVKGGLKVKSSISSRILEGLPSRLKIGTIYSITLDIGSASCTYKISIEA